MSTWKPIPGFEDCGEVSDCGQIRDIDGKLRKLNVSPTGYVRVGFYSGRKTVNVHRLVALAFCNGYANNLQVNHIDGNKANNRASNLEWVTASENRRHAFSSGLQVAARTNMVIPDEDLPGLLERKKQGATYRELAEGYGVTHKAVFKRLKKFNGGLVHCP